MLPRVLTIAGSDSGGGAGIQADLKVMTASEVYGMSVITAITSQNTLQVDAVQLMDPSMVEKQFRAVVDDIGCDVVKIGMLGNSSNTRKVADLLREYQIAKNVIDPVMVATSGAILLETEAIDAFLTDLLPTAYILTPNLQEAKLLLAASRGLKVSEMPESSCLEDIEQLAKELQGLGPQFVLVKGGHLPLNAQMQACQKESERLFVADVLCGPEINVSFKSAWSPTKNTHGTGCTLATAIACEIAKGRSVVDAVESAIAFVHGAISQSFGLGSGSGPLNHMYRLSSLPFYPGRFVDYLINHQRVKPLWRAYTEHDFVERVADGSLPTTAFKYFLKQDYLYLIQYARLHGLAAYKSENLDMISGSAEIILHIKRETSVHIQLCESFGISAAELQAGVESTACTAYTRYIESIGNSRDWFSLQVALAACLIGYGVVGKRLSSAASSNPTSAYSIWINAYNDGDYTAAVEKGKALLERHAMDLSPSKVDDLVEIFRRTTKYEVGFWSDAINR